MRTTLFSIPCIIKKVVHKSCFRIKFRDEMFTMMMMMYKFRMPCVFNFSTIFQFALFASFERGWFRKWWCTAIFGRAHNSDTHVTSPWHHRPNLVHFFQKQCILMLIFKCIFVLLFLMPANMKKLRTNKKYALYAHFPWLYKFFNFQFRARRRTIGNGKLFMMVFVW